MNRRLLALLTTVVLTGCPGPEVGIDPDSGSSDSGNGDSGSSDSGSTDSGSVDSGSLDSGTVDAGAPDSGQPDGGQADSGQPDSGSLPLNQWSWNVIPGSQCGSGATAGLAINKGPTDDDLFIFVQGGGACWNGGTCIPSITQFGPLCEYGNICLLDAQGGTQPTAVNVQGDPYPADAGGVLTKELSVLKASRIFNRALADNPFRTANFVYVPYCTGDLHSGNTTRNYTYRFNLADADRTYTMHFAGGANMALYVAKLKALFPGVKRIWLTGASGGAFGATLNFDRFSRGFPTAEVHLLADSAPFLQPVAHWPEWLNTWNMQLPENCTDCDAGFPKIISTLTARYPTRRIALLSTDQDKVIRWFLLAPQGLNNFLNPPALDLSPLLAHYDSTPNAKYFVVGGEQHVLIGEYGAALPDGGYTAPLKSRDGGTDLRQWLNAWATGDAGWSSTR